MAEVAGAVHGKVEGIGGGPPSTPHSDWRLLAGDDQLTLGLAQPHHAGRTAVNLPAEFSVLTNQTLQCMQHKRMFSHLVNLAQLHLTPPSQSD